MELRSSLPYTNLNELTHPAWLERLSNQLASVNLVLRAGIGWIFDLGVQKEMPFYLQKNLALINILSFISLIMALPGSFLLLLVGFEYTFSLLAAGILILCLVLALNAAHQVQWAQAVFAYSPAAISLTYILFGLSSGSMTDLMVYILARQAFCLALLLPVLIYGFEKSHRWITLCGCVFIFLFVDVASLHIENPLLMNTGGIIRSFFSVLSVVQYAGLAACVLYVQGYTLRQEMQSRQSNEKLHYMAIRDGMTGIFNHTYIEQLISDSINRSKRSKLPLSLLMIDIDNFKQVNDTFGHNAGDETLTHLTKLLEDGKRSTDYLGRWGGDELILLLTDTNLAGAMNVAEKLRARVESHTFPRQKRLTISLGASGYQDGDNPTSFIDRADTALYRAKRSGRNRAEIQA